MFEYLPERPLEPPEEKPIAYCDYCGGEIYEARLCTTSTGSSSTKTACTTSPMTTSRTAKRRL